MKRIFEYVDTHFHGIQNVLAAVALCAVTFALVTASVWFFVAFIQWVF